MATVIFINPPSALHGDGKPQKPLGGLDSALHPIGKERLAADTNQTGCVK